MADPASTIVSVTPLPVRADSRTYKQAASFARFGYRSIVVEGSPSGFASNELPFELVSLPPRESASSATRPRTSPSASSKRSARLVDDDGPEQATPSAVLRFAKHLRIYLRHYVRETHAAIPPASLYWLHAFHQFPAVYWRSVIADVPFIYDAHDFYSQLEDRQNLTGYWRYWVAPLESTMERLCVSRAAGVVTVNEGVAQLMTTRFGCIPTVLRNAHDARLDKTVDRTIRDVVGLGNDEYLVVSVGNWKTGMAIEESLSALAMLPANTHLVFLGSGFPDYSETARKKGVAGRVHVLKPVLPSEVVPFIASANAAIVLYYERSLNNRYALPNRFFQPIAAGLPLLYPPLPEIRRIADHYGIGILVDPRDPNAIAAALHSIRQEPDRLRSIKAGLMAARQELSWEREEQALKALVENLIGLPNASQAKAMPIAAQAVPK